MDQPLENCDKDTGYCGCTPCRAEARKRFLSHFPIDHSIRRIEKTARKERTR